MDTLIGYIAGMSLGIGFVFLLKREMRVKSVKLNASGMKASSIEVIGYTRYLTIPPLDGQWSAVYKIYMQDGSVYWTTLQPWGGYQNGGPYHTFLSNTPIIPEQKTRPSAFPNWLTLAI